MGWGSRIAWPAGGVAAIALTAWICCPAGDEHPPAVEVPVAAAEAAAPNTAAPVTAAPAPGAVSRFAQHQREAAARRAGRELDRKREREEIERRLQKLLGSQYRRLLKELDAPLEPTPAEFPHGDPAYAPMGPGGCAAGRGRVAR